MPVPEYFQERCRFSMGVALMFSDVLKAVTLLLIGAGVTLIVQWLLQRFGIIHRYTEQLWQARLKLYDELIASAHGAFDAAMRWKDDGEWAELVPSVDAYLLTMERVGVVSSVDVDRAARVLAGQLFMLRHLDPEFRSPVRQKLIENFYDLVEQVRLDLSIKAFDEKAKEWIHKQSAETRRQATGVNPLRR